MDLQWFGMGQPYPNDAVGMGLGFWKDGPPKA